MVIKTKDIVAILDLDNTTTSKITRDYLANVQKKGYVVTVSDELPKSYVICDNGKEVKVYISQLSSRTLEKRTDYINKLGVEI